MEEQGAPETSAEAEMRFDVDLARLGDTAEVSRYGVRFRPPAAWQALSAETMQAVQQAAAAAETEIRVEPLRAFADTVQGSFLSVSALHGFSDEAFDAQMAQYAEALQAEVRRRGRDSLRQASFRRDRMRVMQFLLEPDGQVNFKLVLDTPLGGPLQFDYVVPRPQYPAAVRAIESSIGSIRQMEARAPPGASQ